MSAPLAVFVDGMDAASLPLFSFAANRGLHYGDGVFRTLLRHAGRMVDLDRQLAHLAADAARLQLDAPDPARWREDIAAVCANRDQAVVKLMLVRRGAARGYASTERRSERWALAYPAPVYPPECWKHGVSLVRSPLHLAAQPRLAGVKHLNRLEQVLAAREVPEGAQDAIMSDAEGRPSCGTRSNLFWIRDEGLHTPALSTCGVAGMMRSRVLEAAAKLGLRPVIAAAPWEALMAADEVFLTSSLVGIWPVRSLDGQAFEAPGVLTRRLMHAIDHPLLVAP